MMPISLSERFDRGANQRIKIRGHAKLLIAASHAGVTRLPPKFCCPYALPQTTFKHDGMFGCDTWYLLELRKTSFELFGYDILIDDR